MNISNFTTGSGIFDSIIGAIILTIAIIATKKAWSSSKDFISTSNKIITEANDAENKKRSLAESKARYRDLYVKKGHTIAIKNISMGLMGVILFLYSSIGGPNVPEGVEVRDNFLVESALFVIILFLFDSAFRTMKSVDAVVSKWMEQLERENDR